jgi:hypothetical protein
MQVAARMQVEIGIAVPAASILIKTATLARAWGRGCSATDSRPHLMLRDAWVVLERKSILVSFALTY